MIDLHMHILPGFDDGARDLYESLEMVHTAAAHGTKVIVATPHCNIPGLFTNYFGPEYIAKIKKLREAVHEAEIPVKILPGMEVFATTDLPQLIEDGAVLTLNRSKYLLVEFDFGEREQRIHRLLAGIKGKGLIPLIAHVERYDCVKENPELICKWIRKGCKIQVNKGSFEGRFGKDSMELAYLLLDHHLLHVIASDAHGANSRTSNMQEVYELLCESYPEKYIQTLFTGNPSRILRNEATINYKMIAFEEKEKSLDGRKEKKQRLEKETQRPRKKRGAQPQTNKKQKRKLPKKEEE